MNVGVDIDHHVDVARHAHSVPYPLRGQRVDVRATTTVVEVFHKGRRVASHVRARALGACLIDVNYSCRSCCLTKNRYQLASSKSHPTRPRRSR